MNQYRWNHTVYSIGMALFGLPFFGMGSFFVYGMLTADKINGKPPDLLFRLLFSTFPLVFVIIGLSMIGYFSRVIVDRKRASLIKQWGLFLIPFSSTVEKF